MPAALAFPEAKKGLLVALIPNQQKLEQALADVEKRQLDLSAKEVQLQLRAIAMDEGRKGATTATPPRRVVHAGYRSADTSADGQVPASWSSGPPVPAPAPAPSSSVTAAAPASAAHLPGSGQCAVSQSSRLQLLCSCCVSEVGMCRNVHWRPEPYHHLARISSKLSSSVPGLLQNCIIRVPGL